MSNTDTNGVPYGVISMSSIDADLAHELFYGANAIDVSWQDAINDAKAAAIAEFQEYEESAEDSAMDIEDEDERLEAISEQLNLQFKTDDITEYVDRRLDDFAQDYQADEPRIEGTYEGVIYAINWLGGAPLLWVFSGPRGSAHSYCSPCVPGAADLDSGFALDDSLPVKCYCVPTDWLAAHEIKAAA